MSDTTGKITTLFIIVLGLALFVVLSQPAWGGEEMLSSFRLNCDKRGGILLEHKKMFGTEYSCESYLGENKATTREENHE